jgi:hypothetical protein
MLHFSITSDSQIKYYVSVEMGEKVFLVFVGICSGFKYLFYLLVSFVPYKDDNVTFEIPWILVAFKFWIWSVEDFMKSSPQIIVRMILIGQCSYNWSGSTNRNNLYMNLLNTSESREWDDPLQLAALIYLWRHLDFGDLTRMILGHLEYRSWHSVSQRKCKYTHFPVLLICEVM